MSVVTVELYEPVHETVCVFLHLVVSTDGID